MMASKGFMIRMVMDPWQNELRKVVMSSVLKHITVGKGSRGTGCRKEEKKRKKEKRERGIEKKLKREKAKNRREYWSSLLSFP